MTDDFEKMDPLAGDEPEGKPTLKEIWENNPSLKIAAFASAVVVAGVLLFAFAGKEEAPVKSALMLGSGLETKEAPGKEVSPAYEEALREKNEARAEQAKIEGISALPTPIGSNKGRLVAPATPAKPTTDPLAEWRKAVEDRRKKIDESRVAIKDQEKPEIAPVTQPIQQKPQQQKQFEPAYVDLMMSQMQAILETKQPKPATGLVITQIESAYTGPQKSDAGTIPGEGQGDGQGAGTETEETEADVIVQAGEVLYAQMLTALNSDTPGPVLAQVVSGPIAGSRIIGSFQKTEENLVVTFQTVVYEGKTYSINAVALSPKTTLPALASKVDRHYMARVVLPAAAAFVEGVGKAVAQTDNTTVTVNGETVTSETSDLNTNEELAKGAEEAASKVSDILDDAASGKKEPTVSVKSGIPIGVFFVESLTAENKKR